MPPTARAARGERRGCIMAGMVEPLAPERDGLGTRMRLSARMLHRAARYRLKLNPEELRRLLPHLPRGGVAIDAGAHKGAYTWWFAKGVGAGGRVLAFEPQPELAEQTARAAKALGLGQVRVYAAGLSEASGEARLAYLESTTHGATLNGLDFPETRHRVIPTVAVDDLGLAQLDVMKIDVEGHEQPVLRGARGALERFGPALLIEIETRLHEDGASPVTEVCGLLEPMGYEGWFFARDGVRPVGEFDAAAHQRYGKGHYSNNFLFMRKGRGAVRGSV